MYKWYKPGATKHAAASDAHQTIVQRIQAVAEFQPDSHAQLIKKSPGVFVPRTYKALMEEVYRAAHFFKNRLGVRRGDSVALISHNRAEWIICNLGLLSIGAVDVPRGSDTVVSEISYILEHSGCVGAIFETREIFEAVAAYKASVVKKLSFVLLLEKDAPGKTPEKNQDKNAAKSSATKSAKTSSPKPASKTSTSKQRAAGAQKTISSPAFPAKKICYYEDLAAGSLTPAEVRAVQADIARTKGSERAAIIYTSGTTAHPKGVCLKHLGFLLQVDAIIPEVLQLRPYEILVSVLPVWHSYEREIQYITLASGACTAYSKPIGKVLLEDIQAVQAHWITSVPRIWEGVYSAIHKKVRAGSPVKRAIFSAATAVGILHEKCRHFVLDTYPAFTTLARKQRVAVPRAARRIGAALVFALLFPARFVLDALVFKKIRALLGKRFTAGVSGGGALPSHVDWFFQAARIGIAEGYGLTETSPVLSVRSQRRPEANSVGKILRGIEHRVLDRETRLPVEDGKEGILFVRTPQVMEGYYKDPKATAAVLSKDGWLSTGDLVVRDSSGVIKITGRDNELLVLRSGENVSPTRVENALKESEYIENAIAFGHTQKYIAALLVVDAEALGEYAKKQGISFTSLQALTEDKAVRALMSEEMARCNSQLNVHERVLRYKMIATPFQIAEELTQTLKLKRRYIMQKYAAEIAELY